MTIGYSGTGSFTQSGGTHSVSNCLYLGVRRRQQRTYSLSGSGLLATPTSTSATPASGSFTQSGGTNSVSNLLYLGTAFGGSGTLSILSGNGVLSRTDEIIGFDYGRQLSRSRAEPTRFPAVWSLPKRRFRGNLQSQRRRAPAFGGGRDPRLRLRHLQLRRRHARAPAPLVLAAEHEPDRHGRLPRPSIPLAATSAYPAF